MQRGWLVLTVSPRCKKRHQHCKSKGDRGSEYCSAHSQKNIHAQVKYSHLKMFVFTKTAKGKKRTSLHNSTWCFILFCLFWGVGKLFGSVFQSCHPCKVVPMTTRSGRVKLADSAGEPEPPAPRDH